MLIKAPLLVPGHDLYETPAEATLALLNAEPLPRCLWECACGHGAIVRPLRAAGHEVFATDLVDYASLDQDRAGWDFLLKSKLPNGVQTIITSPLAAEFVEHALRLCPRVLMLLRLTFLESRTTILDTGNLARVHVFKKQASGVASRQLERTTGVESNGVWLVRLGPHPPRAAHTSQNFRATGRPHATRAAVPAGRGRHRRMRNVSF